jgi:methylenetetrahydrofolate dehydrogenase (NADP+)/methenyltetrahydrofolate cyclohydrolase
VPATVIDGRKLAAELRSQVERDVAAFRASTGLAPRLDVVMVGDNPASQAYVGTKARMAGEVGITSRVHALPAGITQGELLGFLGKLDADEEVDGILVQLPLPAHIDADVIPEALSPGKDVDGFHPLNLGRLAGGCWPDPARRWPARPQGSRPRPLHHRRPADGAPPARSRLHRDHRPLAHARPAPGL